MKKISILLIASVFTVFVQSACAQSNYEFWKMALNKIEVENYEGAIAITNKAIKLDPKYYRHYGLRAKAKYKLGDYKGAIADYSKVIQFVPESANSYIDRAKAKRMLKDYQEALKDCNKSMELNPEYPRNYYCRGLMKYELKDYEGAISDLDKAIEFRPIRDIKPNIYYIRALLRFKTGDKEGALQDYKKAENLGYFKAKDLDYLEKEMESQEMKETSEKIQKIIEEKKKEEERIKKEKEEKERELRKQQERKRILRKTLQNNIFLISSKRKEIEELYIEIIFIGGNRIKKTRKKSIYNAGILLYDDWNSELTNSTDNEKKLELSNNIIRLLNKLIELSNEDTKALQKSLKKEEDINTIIKLLDL